MITPGQATGGTQAQPDYKQVLEKMFNVMTDVLNTLYAGKDGPTNLLQYSHERAIRLLEDATIYLEDGIINYERKL
jgi:hypothetical protein